MTTSRSSQVSLSTTPWYHCTTRCVRQAFLCGKDVVSGKNCDHRRQWIEDRLVYLSTIFCIDIAAFAVMSNHYHVVFRVDTVGANELTDDQVIGRMGQLYRPNLGTKRYCENLSLSKEEQLAFQKQLKHWRSLLTDLSRFMAEVNQFIARKANIEADRKGRFWEARFHSQAILDTAALLRTLVYVDLNPIRAKQSTSVLQSKHTSILRRLSTDNHGLMPFKKKVAAASPLTSADFSADWNSTVLPISSADYQRLLDWTARYVKTAEMPATDGATEPLVLVLGYSGCQWMRSQVARTTWHQRAIGLADNIVNYCKALSRQRIWVSADHKIER